MKRTISLVLALALGRVTEIAQADFTFGTPDHIGPPINSPYSEALTCITADGLEMYISSLNRPGGYGSWDIWVLRRETVNDDWDTPENLGPPINTGGSDGGAYISSDDLEMYFVAYNKPGGYGDSDIWVARRTSKNGPWAQPENLGPIVNSSNFEHSPIISTDGLELYFSSNRSGGYGVEDLWVTKRATKNDPWSHPVNLGPSVNSSASEDYPRLSSDGLLLFFSEYKDTVGSFRPGGYGDPDIWVARRASTSDPWGTPVNLGPTVNTSYLDCAATLSPDGQTLYFNSERPGGLGGPYGDIFQAPIIPIVDLNGDGIVDSSDMCMIVDNWGTDHSLCDIGPMPWGDGIVDVQDLIVLAEHLFEDDRLVANRALDETEGNIAYDGTGENYGTLHGSPTWRPVGGQYDGALEFDGIDDYISTPFILDPAKGSFSAFAWIKGGSPGQVIISQTGRIGETWLGINHPDGGLMTGLGDIYFGVLESQSKITDDQWHQVGLVYDFDALHRRLYVDGTRVAEDVTFVAPQPSDGGLNIGASKDLDTRSFFSGLTDDVRIYNRAVSP